MPKMTKPQLIRKLRQIKEKYVTNKKHPDYECSHWDADIALLDYIDDAEVKELHDELAIWYS